MEAPRQLPWVQGSFCPFAPPETGHTGARLPRPGPSAQPRCRLLGGASSPPEPSPEPLAPSVIVTPFCAPRDMFHFFFFNFLKIELAFTIKFILFF